MRILFLLLPQVHLMDVAGPAQVFHIAQEYGKSYDLHYCSTEEAVQSAQGLNLSKLSPLLVPKPEDLIMVVGVRIYHEGKASYPHVYKDDRVIAWLRQADKLGVRIASICSGTLALAQAGLLEGRRCTSHWRLTEMIKEYHPTAKVQDAVLFVEDGNIVSSAGVSSGIDLSLYLLEQNHGPALAAKVAREMVIYLRRNGSNTQQSLYLSYRNHPHNAVHKVQDYLLRHAHEPVRQEALARLVHMSPRSLSRAFKEHTGLTPLQYQQRLRLEQARNLLENPQLSIEAVAERCGFQDPRHFRRLWRREFGVAPSVMRLGEQETN